MWDGGAGRSSHQEFGSRMVVKDGSASINHATHVFLSNHSYGYISGWNYTSGGG